jgi:hypothetical protein
LTPDTSAQTCGVGPLLGCDWTFRTYASDGDWSLGTRHLTLTLPVPGSTRAQSCTVFQLLPVQPVTPSKI